jgi:hypothetical protein
LCAPGALSCPLISRLRGPAPRRYCMDASFMLLLLHERGIHAVRRGIHAVRRGIHAVEEASNAVGGALARTPASARTVGALTPLAITNAVRGRPKQSGGAA